jgi:hypothetical protein
LLAAIFNKGPKQSRLLVRNWNTSTTDISEKGLETLIMRHMTGTDGLAFAAEGIVAETPDALAAAKAAGSGWLAGHPKDYDRSQALDVPQLFSFLHATQPDTVHKLGIGDYKDGKDINRQKLRTASPNRRLRTPSNSRRRIPSGVRAVRLVTSAATKCVRFMLSVKYPGW